ncbi:hypothetical protein WG66_001618, partial [Moniliophthora roreri]
PVLTTVLRESTLLSAHRHKRLASHIGSTPHITIIADTFTGSKATITVLATRMWIGGWIENYLHEAQSSTVGLISFTGTWVSPSQQ